MADALKCSDPNVGGWVCNYILGISEEVPVVSTALLPEISRGKKLLVAESRAYSKALGVVLGNASSSNKRLRFVGYAQTALYQHGVRLKVEVCERRLHACYRKWVPNGNIS